MRKSLGVIAALAVLCVLTVSPVAVSAKHIVHLEVTIDPGMTYQDPQDLQRGEVLSCAWATDHPVKFHLTDTDGETIRQSNGTVGQVVMEITKSGTYTFNWQNNGDVTVRLSFDKGFLPDEESSMLWVVVLAILIALVALALAAIVYLSMRKMPKK